MNRQWLYAKPPQGKIAADTFQWTETAIPVPKEGEVLVEVKATGICHTDEYTLSGADPEGVFPAVLGHEGAAQQGLTGECAVARCGSGFLHAHGRSPCRRVAAQ